MFHFWITIFKRQPLPPTAIWMIVSCVQNHQASSRTFLSYCWYCSIYVIIVILPNSFIFWFCHLIGWFFIYSLIITKLLISFPEKKKKKSLPADQSITLQEYLICHGSHSGHVSELGCSLVTWLTRHRQQRVLYIPPRNGDSHFFVCSLSTFPNFR